MRLAAADSGINAPSRGMHAVHRPDNETTRERQNERERTACHARFHRERKRERKRTLVSNRLSLLPDSVPNKILCPYPSTVPGECCLHVVHILAQSIIGISKRISRVATFGRGGTTSAAEHWMVTTTTLCG